MTKQSGYGLLLALLLCGAGCGRQPVDTLAREAPLVWPSPPEAGRIEYLYSLSRPEDVGVSPSFFKKVVRVLTGKADQKRMVRPCGLYARRGILYVADPGMQAVHAFNFKKHRYHQINRFSREDFISPIGVTMDDEDNLYISDSVLKTVFVFDGKETPQREIGGAGLLSRPAGITVNPTLGRLYVVDSGAHLIQVFDLQGHFLFTIGRRGTEEGTFNFPTFICIDRKGLLYVTDSLNYRIQTFNPDGRFLYQFGRLGDGMGEFSHPKGIAVDSEGDIYVTDGIFDAIQIFDKAGTLLMYLGEAGQGPGQFWIPTAIFIDCDDRIFVSDSYNQRVQVLRFLGGGKR